MSQEASGSSRQGFATGANVAYLEELYRAFIANPLSVDESWRKFFEGYEFAAKSPLETPSFAATGAGSAGSTGSTGSIDSEPTSPEDDGIAARVSRLISTFRKVGHFSSHLNPLEDQSPGLSKDLSLEAHGLDKIPRERIFKPANLPIQTLNFGEIQQLLLDTYCRTIGADFREVPEGQIVEWFQQKMESCRNHPILSPQLKKHILEKLRHAEEFEQFLGRRFVGAKRFSIEGVDALVPLLDIIASEAAQGGSEELCLGMAHRGRLNVLANFLGKGYEYIFKEFEGADFNPYDIDGDVKYHMGFASEVSTFSGHKIRLYLSPNPSHLEQVNPVVEGFVKARQRLLGDSDRTKVIPVLMHGDASFIGQGMVAETLNLSNLEAYNTGGTIHIIINNQIGFTTEPKESRSTAYSSDVAKMVRAPVLHVNADDPEAVIWCAQLACAYRQTWHGDIVIDLVGYRRHGHNEGDEPAFTQPMMYRKIASHKTAFAQYGASLVAQGVISAKELDEDNLAFRNKLQAAYEIVHGKKNLQLPAPQVPASFQKSIAYKRATREDIDRPSHTAVPGKTLKSIADKLTKVPDGFQVNPKLKRVLESRSKMLDGIGQVDWAFAELLSLSTVLLEGRYVRLTGQDVGRGTFVSRHAVFVDFETNARHLSMGQLSKDQGGVEVVNSPLSECGCLGFEFGYSVADPEALVLWEAQFGDFANGAQIIIDQFISASEAKWRQTSSLVLLLPHGYEGQGPEHSSARPERFLQLCGSLNIQVAVPTTPAQHFHILRRQLNREFRKPLVLMTPKSLLREPLCVSSVAAFEKSRFFEVLDDDSVEERRSCERLIICAGKVYYDLLKARTKEPSYKNIPIVRIEQFYPFPYRRVEEVLASYPNLREIIWTQEEPQNMGGWQFVRGRLIEGVLQSHQSLTYVGRKNAGTPAEGSLKAHEAEQGRIITESLGRASGVVTSAPLQQKG